MIVAYKKLSQSHSDILLIAVSSCCLLYGKLEADNLSSTCILSLFIHPFYLTRQATSNSASTDSIKIVDTCCVNTNLWGPK